MENTKNEPIVNSQNTTVSSSPTQTPIMPVNRDTPSPKTTIPSKVANIKENLKGNKPLVVGLISGIVVLILVFLVIVSVIVRLITGGGSQTDDSHLPFGFKPSPTPIVVEGSLEAKIKKLRSEVDVFRLQETQLLPPSVEWDPEF